MMNPHASAEIDDTWSRVQTELRGHMLQSGEWAAFQEALGRRVERENGPGWAWQGYRVTSRLGAYLYTPYGPTVRTSGQWLDIARSWRRRTEPVDFVRFEPQGKATTDELEQLGARRVADVQPSYTAILDLRVDEPDLRSGLASGHRSRINGAERRGLSFRESTNRADVAEFLRLIHATAARTGFRPHGDDYFETMLEVLMPLGVAKLFLAEHENAVVAASITLDYAGVRYYAHAASDYEARKLQAPVSLVWHMLLDAKRVGLRTFDFWGVAPEGAPDSHDWAGFTAFKLAFGAERVAYAGTWELPLNPAKYQAFRLAKAVKKILGGKR